MKLKRKINSTRDQKKIFQRIRTKLEKIIYSKFGWNDEIKNKKKLPQKKSRTKIKNQNNKNWNWNINKKISYKGDENILKKQKKNLRLG